MKTPIFLATALGLAALATNAHADGATPVALGAGAAHLAASQSAQTGDADRFVLRHDPTGAPMCFTAAGAKAPLASCDGGAEGDSSATDYTVSLDPTGVPMCFDAAGSKAPLSACDGAVAAWLDADGGPQIAAR